MTSEFKYFKKKKMYELLTLIIGEDDLEPMRYASYRFYRGSEWLWVGSVEAGVYYSLYRCKGYVSLDVYSYDYTLDAYKSIDRKCYKAVNSLSEAINCTYSRNEVV